jgi:hypothetical protein
MTSRICSHDICQELAQVNSRLAQQDVVLAELGTKLKVIIWVAAITLPLGLSAVCGLAYKGLIADARQPDQTIRRAGVDAK